MNKKYILLLLIATLLCGGLLFPDYREMMDTADRLYTERGDLDKARQAFDIYKKIIDEKPDDYEALWKAGKTAFYLLEMITDKKEKKRIVKEAEAFAKRAVEVNPEGVEGHFWLGVLYTKVGEIKGVLKALFLINPAKKEMRKVIAMNDKYEEGGAYVVLGRIYSVVPGLFGGNNKKARMYYEKAKIISPKNSLNLLFMAQTYWDLKERESAIETLEFLINMDPDPRYIPEAGKNKRAGAELLAKFRRKMR